MQDKGCQMTKTTAQQTPMPKRISPELAEVLHMLKSLETQPAAKPSQASTR
jgi:hypothetical protein